MANEDVKLTIGGDVEPLKQVESEVSAIVQSLADKWKEGIGATVKEYTTLWTAIGNVKNQLEEIGSRELLPKSEIESIRKLINFEDVEVGGLQKINKELAEIIRRADGISKVDLTGGIKTASGEASKFKVNIADAEKEIKKATASQVLSGREAARASLAFNQEIRKQQAEQKKRNSLSGRFNALLKRNGVDISAMTARLRTQSAVFGVVLGAANGLREAINGLWDQAKKRTELAIQAVKNYNRELLSGLEARQQFEQQFNSIAGGNEADIAARRRGIERLRDALTTAENNQPELDETAQGGVTGRNRVDVARARINKELVENIKKQIEEEQNDLRIAYEQLRVERLKTKERERQKKEREDERKEQERQGLLQRSFRRAFNNVAGNERQRQSDERDAEQKEKRIESLRKQERNSLRQIAQDDVRNARRREDFERSIARIRRDQNQAIGGFDRGFASLGNRIAEAASTPGDDKVAERIEDLRRDYNRAEVDAKNKRENQNTILGEIRDEIKKQKPAGMTA